MRKLAVATANDRKGYNSYIYSFDLVSIESNKEEDYLFERRSVLESALGKYPIFIQISKISEILVGFFIDIFDNYFFLIKNSISYKK